MHEADHRRRQVSLAALLALSLAGCGSAGAKPPAPGGREALVDLHTVAPSIITEMRYYGRHNFIGRRIVGYEAPKCLLSRRAAAALAKVQTDLEPFGLGLKVYDCYRPQRAVDLFGRWARSTDTTMKREFYPNVPKGELHERGYIARRSGHSRGSTVDITLVRRPPPAQPAWRPGMPLVPCYEPAGKRFDDNSLDMGTGYDCLDPRAHTASSDVGFAARRNRALLVAAMARRGFVSYSKEWWHFTLANEPFPDTYFDVPIR